ncbi:MAG: ABC transporter ATP-binding protein [Burkholderiales bacterium]
MTAALRIDGLHKRFGSRQVLDGFSLEVARGEVVGLLGPNGCGKSTVLNIVCQLLQADAGEIRLMGEPLVRLGAEARARVGLCAQDCALYPDLLPEENLNFFGRLHGVPAAQRQARIADLMERFGLGPHAATRVGRLSGGWQQRLHLAVSLVHRPELLVLDEPTAAVDVAARLELWRLIEGLRDTGTTILLTSHHLAEAERLCSRVAVMQGGRVAALGTVPELLARVPGQSVATVQSRDSALTVHRAQRLGWAVRQRSGQLSCLLPRHFSLREVVDALDGPEVSAVSVRAVALEDAYLELVGDGAGLD